MDRPVSKLWRWSGADVAWFFIAVATSVMLLSASWAMVKSVDRPVCHCEANDE